MRRMLLLALAGMTFVGCLGGGAVPQGSSGGSAPGSGSGGTTGQTGSGGTSSGSGGSDSTGSGGSASESGGSNGTSSGGSTGTSSGGSTGTSSGGSTGTSSGGSTGTGSGGATSGGGSTTTGSGGAGGGTSSGSGGKVGTGGATGSGGSGMAGTSGGSFSFPVLRVDDPCGSLLSGNVCLHQGKASDNGTPFSKMAQVTVGGTSGTMYQVKIRVRGVTEPTHVNGGTAGNPANFITGGSSYADNTNEGQYQQWRITTTVPNQHYYVNVFTANLSHIVKLLDFTATIPIGGGSTVTLDLHDGNAHQISNTVNNPPLAPTGVPGSMTSGQFVQVDSEGVQ